MTITLGKSFQPTLEMVQAAENLFLAMAIRMSIEPVVLAYQRAILAKGQWKTAQALCVRGRKQEVITEPKEYWLMSEDDLQNYLEQCELAKAAAGFKDAPSKCPLLAALETERLATIALIDTLQPLTKFTYAQLASSQACLENIQKAKDLSLKLMAPFVRNASEILAA